MNDMIEKAKKEVKEIVLKALGTAIAENIPTIAIFLVVRILVFSCFLFCIIFFLLQRARVACRSGR